MVNKALEMDDFDLEESAVNGEGEPQNKKTKVTVAAGKDIKKKRLTLDIEPELHTKLKMKAVEQGKTMVDLVEGWIEKQV